MHLLGKMGEFAGLRGFLNSMSVDPLEKYEVTRRWFDYQQKLDELYTQLRASCLVRRAHNPGLRIQREVESVYWTCMPERIDRNEVRSSQRELGLFKVAGVIDWLRDFLPNQTGKVLIVVHHNDVIEEIAAVLDLPAIYGKVGNAARDALFKEFSYYDGFDTLIMADQADLPSSLPRVTALVLAELFITPQQLFNFVNCICGENNAIPLPVYHLVVFKSGQDRDALLRLGVRLQGIGSVLDGEVGDDERW